MVIIDLNFRFTASEAGLIKWAEPVFLDLLNCRQPLIYIHMKYSYGASGYYV